MFTQFVNAALLSGLAVVGLPVLIHLINMLRHRRVPWAAMEFLLQSQKKNRTWVRLKELLLLLLRMAAVAAVVLILAQPLADASSLLDWLGQRTQHIVVLDDSYSQADRWAGSTAFDRAKAAIARIASQAAQDSSGSDFTIWRSSQAAKSAEARPDVNAEQVTINFSEKLQERIAAWQPSDLSTSPEPAFDAVLQSFEENAGLRRVVYLVSDFRAKEWDAPGSLAEKLSRLQALPARLKFVQCADQQRPNLTIANLEPAGGIVAAGVPFSMQVTVTNHSSAAVKNLSLALEEDGVGRSALEFDLIAPNTSESRSFPVNFATAGEHLVTARIPSDTVGPDNIRQRVVDVPLNNRVLILDGRDTALDGKFLLDVFLPGGRVKTGIEPTLERPTWLNNHELAGFNVVYLANVERLDPPAVTALEKFAQSGGGVAFFLGDATSVEFYNTQLYRDGVGCFPLPLQAATPLIVDRLEQSGDIEVVAAEHPMFRIFTGERNSFLSAVKVDMFVAAPRSWQPAADSTTQVIAKLRNGSPLAVERRFGQGRVIAITTTAGRAWSNWSGNPSFVIAMLELQAHLSADRVRGQDREAGAPLIQSVDLEKYQRRVRLVPPRGSGRETISTDVADSSRGPIASFPDTSAAGVYELQLATLDNASETRHYALNVDPREGDLALLDAEQLAARLPGIKFETLRADQLALAASSADRANISDLLLYGLVALLLGEQALAYAVSYHPAPVAGRAA